MLTLANFDYKEYINYSRKQPDVDDDDEEPSDFFYGDEDYEYWDIKQFFENYGIFDYKYCWLNIGISKKDKFIACEYYE